MKSGPRKTLRRGKKIVKTIPVLTCLLVIVRPIKKNACIIYSLIILKLYMTEVYKNVGLHHRVLNHVSNGLAAFIKLKFSSTKCNQSCSSAAVFLSNVGQSASTLCKLKFCDQISTYKFFDQLTKLNIFWKINFLIGIIVVKLTL